MWTLQHDKFSWVNKKAGKSYQQWWPVIYIDSISDSIGTGSSILNETRVCSWNIYPTHLFVVYEHTQESVHTCVFVDWVADRIKQGHVLTTTCDFKWGGAKKPIAPITVKKNCLDLYQAQKYPLIVFHWVGMSVNTLATLLWSTFTNRQTDTQTQGYCFTPAVHVHGGNNAMYQKGIRCLLPHSKVHSVTRVY